MGLFSKLKAGLKKTRNQISSIVGNEKNLDDNFYEMLVDALISADVGYDLSEEFIEELRVRVKDEKLTTISEAYNALKDILVEELSVVKLPDEFPPKPWIILVIGVNGVGKTTTIGKIAHKYRENGRQVMLAAADTFRAGAIEQLKVWSDKSGCQFIAQRDGSDAASVVFDAMEAAKARTTDVLIIDTAGRLHNKVNLMNELEKIHRVIKRNTPHAPNELLLVVDATTGQNAIRQAEVFHKSLGLTGFVITKLDGTAKGGIAVALTKKFKVPVRKIGVGEMVDDLQNFSARDFVDAMLGDIK